MKKYAVCYNSLTGNTENLAEAIYKISPSDCIYYGEPDLDEIESAEIIFVGFWTNMGQCDKYMQEFLKEIHNKKLALFGTAGYGDSLEYFNTILNKVSEHIDESNEIIDCFMCQGEMQAEVLVSYNVLLNQNPGNKDIQTLIENFNAAKNRPNIEDIKNCREFAKKILEG